MKKLTHKTILLTTLLITLSTAAITFAVYQNVKDLLITHAMEELADTATQEGAKFTAIINEIKNDTLFLAGTPPIQGIIRAQEDQGYDSQDKSTTQQWQQRLENIFNTLLHAKPHYMQARLIDAAGYEQVRVDRVNGNVITIDKSHVQDKSREPYTKLALKLQRGEVYLSEVSLNREHGKIQVPHVPVIRSATPIYNQHGTVMGFVIINLNFGAELDYIETLYKSGNHKLLIANHEGHYLVHPDNNKRFGFETGHRYRVHEEHPRLAKLFIPGNKQTSVTLLPYKSNQNAMVMVKLPLDSRHPDKYLALILSRPYQDIIKEETAIIQDNIWIGLLLIAVSALLAALFMRRIVTPLDQMTKNIADFRAGKKDITLPESGNDEIGILTDAFRGMLQQIRTSEDSLKELNRHLEDEVTSRTEALTISEQRWQFALEGSQQGVWDWNIKDNSVFFSRQWKEMLGFKAHDLTDSLDEWKKRVHPDDMPQVLQDIQDHFVGKTRYYENEHRVLCKNGTYKWIQDRGIVVERDNEQNPVRMIGTHTDISQRHYHEIDRQKNVNALQQLHNITTRSSLDFETKIQRLLQLGNETFGTSLAIVSHIVGDDYVVRNILGPAEAPPAGTHFDLGNTYCVHTLKADKPTAFHQAGNSEIKDHPCYKTFQLETYIGAPIIYFGTRYGTLNFSTVAAREHPFTDNDLSLIQLFAQWIGTEMERDFANAELSRFKTTLDYTLDCVFMFEPDSLDFFYANQGAIKQVGYSYDEIMHIKPYDITPNINEKEFHSMIEPLLAGQTNVINFETIHQHKNGTTIPVDIFLQYIDPEGEKPRFVAIVRDITERKRIDKLKNEFISTVSHELRTPLTSIRGSLGLITGGAVGEVSEQASTLLNIAHKNTDRLLLLINDILDLQKIESGNMPFSFKVVTLSDFIADAISSNEPYAQAQEVSLVVENNTSPDTVIIADHDRLLQVMNNLISNAAKFSPSASNIKININATDTTVTISITDKGPGIPEDFRSKIFDKFTQSDSSDTRQVGGTGLGLSIAKLIVEKHNGKISFDTEIGKGTTFYIRLPFMHQSDKILVADNEIDTNAKDILIIEDDADIATLLSLHLKSAGYHCHIAYSAAEAKDLLGSQKFSAITLDLMLPDEDGISLIKYLRADPDFQTMPIVVVSANADAGRKELNGGAIGIIDWLNKPFDTQTLERSLTQAIQKSEKAPHILYIEDDQDIVDIVSTVLIDHASLTTASTLESARHQLATTTFDLVLLDFGLPDGNGLELLAEIKSHAGNPPVVIFSANDVNAHVAKKVNSVLVKSQTDNDGLLTTIKSLLELK